jgi:hypothetical protein
LESTSESMLAVTQVLLDDPLHPLEGIVAADRSTAKTISDVRRAHAPYWKCLDTGETLVTRALPRASNITTQRKRKRQSSDGDGEYVPHQKTENESLNPTARRTSKRLATFAQLEEQSSSTSGSTRSYRAGFTTKRSSSLSSAPTSASSSSFEQLGTPKDIDRTNLAAPIVNRPPHKRPLATEAGWSSDSLDTDSPPQIETTRAVTYKIGPPPKERKLGQDPQVGDRVSFAPYLAPSLVRFSDH